MRARFHLDAAGWFKPGEQVEHLPLIAEAVWESRRLRIGYDRGDRIVDREVDPLGLVLKGGAWYFVAMVDGQTRTYRASRVVRAQATGETFTRPAELDLPAFWADTTAAYERDHPETEVTIRVAPGRHGHRFVLPAGSVPMTRLYDLPASSRHECRRGRERAGSAKDPAQLARGRRSGAGLQAGEARLDLRLGIGILQ